MERMKIKIMNERKKECKIRTKRCERRGGIASWYYYISYLMLLLMSTAISRWKYRFSSDHRSQATSSAVSTWMGDRLGTPRAVDSFFVFILFIISIKTLIVLQIHICLLILSVLSDLFSFYNYIKSWLFIYALFAVHWQGTIIALQWANATPYCMLCSLFSLSPTVRLWWTGSCICYVCLI